MMQLPLVAPSGRDNARAVGVADIFVSYTSSDRDWAFWIGHELEAAGHIARIHEWEIPGGGDIIAWMDERIRSADHVLCIVSNEYMKQPYSSSERRAAQWAALTRPNFLLPIFIERCEALPLFATIKRCDLHGLTEDHARALLKAFLAPAGKYPRAAFPGYTKVSSPATSNNPPVFPGKTALSNVPISVPRYFLGRDEALAEIATKFAHHDGRIAITTLHGMSGVGKTTLAAAYSERHRGDYRATWWIRAQAESTIRADLVLLGVRLGWVDADENEQSAISAVMERLRNEGEEILLIFDNAIDAASLGPYLPRGGTARVLVTSNAHAWRGVAEPVEIQLWPKETGADYLIARTGRTAERSAAEALSEALGGLPLAHEQAAAFCERLDVSLAIYHKRFMVAPARFLDDARHAPDTHNGGMTVTKSFALAIEEAARLNPAAESLIVHAALLAPEPVPLFLFAEARKNFGEPLASALARDDLDDAVAALRTFALVDREAIVDERDPSIVIHAIRLHRLVREVAAMRFASETRDQLRRALIAALAKVYPDDAYRNPASWPRRAVLTPHLLACCETETNAEASTEFADLLNRAGNYLHSRAAYSRARPLFTRSLMIREKVLGPEHPETAASLNDLARLFQAQGDLEDARPLYERALAIYEKQLGIDHRHTATGLNNLASVLQAGGDLEGSVLLYERALAIAEKVCGPNDLLTATCLNNLANLLQEQREFAKARPLYERALLIYEKTLDPEHPTTALGFNNLAGLLQLQGDLSAARPLYERALAIYEKTLDPEHPHKAACLHNLASLLLYQSDIAGARPLFERALAIYENVRGSDHPSIKETLYNLAHVLKAQGDAAGARLLFERFLVILYKTRGRGHPDAATHLENLAERMLESWNADKAAGIVELGSTVAAAPSASVRSE
jgi:tetratricopeptide (TPR) repeat protein